MSTDTRIESLEKQIRTLKRMLFGVFGVVVVTALAGCPTSQSVPDVIQAKKFEVVNDEGKTQVMLGATADGMGALSVHNKDGKRVAALLATASGGILDVFNKDDKLGAHIFADAYGGGLSVFNKDEKRVAGIGADAIGDGFVRTNNSKGDTTGQLPK